MRATTTNVGQVLSIGVFFSLMLIGLAATLPQSMETGLLANMCLMPWHIRWRICRPSRPVRGLSWL